jgi:hypothetical protein
MRSIAIYLITSISLIQCYQSWGQVAQKICTSCEGGGGGGGGAVVTCDNSKAILYVDASRPDNAGDGYTWGTAKKYLHAALYIANRCTNITEVRVAKGTYRASTTASVANRDNNFFIGESYQLNGGYPPGGGTRDYVNNPTILDGEIQDLYEAYHVLVIYGVTGSVVLDGFQIRNGFAEGVGERELEAGVNMNRDDGAGIYMRDASNVTIRNCVLYNNVANSQGGAVFSNDCKVKYINTVLAGNTSGNEGGGIFANNGSEATFTNATFYNNNVFAGNGGAVYSTTGTTFGFYNTILWGNSSLFGGGGTRDIDYSLVQGGATGTNNLATNPQFANASNLNGADNNWFTSDDGLRLSECSPAVNRGSNAAANVPANDITNNSRVYNTTIDIGAYEFQFIPYPDAGNLSTDGDTTDTYVYGGTTALVAGSCETIALVEPNGFSAFSGEVFAKTYVDAAGNPSYFNQPYHNRHYDIDLTAGIVPKTARITLLYDASDFTSYNNRADVLIPLPNTAGENKSNLRILRYTGTSALNSPGSYTGSVTSIDPEDEDIVWDPFKNHWRISFNTPSGAASYFLTAISIYRFSGVATWSNGRFWEGGLPPVDPPAFCEIFIEKYSSCTLTTPQNLSHNSKLIVEMYAQLEINGNLTIVE